MEKRLFVLLMVLCSTVSNVFAYDFRSGNLYYNITSDSTVAVTSGYRELTSAIIPESVTYNGTTYRVTSIESYAFYSCSGLTSITIPNGVTSIGDMAFYGCSSLTSITIPNSVTSIGVWAFYKCTGLTSITIPNSVTSVGGSAFSNCSGLTSIIIPDSVTSIEYRTFFGCSSLTSIAIPNSVTSIGDYAFSGCSGLTSLTIPNNVIYIGYAAFEGTPWRESWLNQQQDGVIYIGNMLYNYKGEMPQGTNIVVKEGTVCICGGAFDGYSGLATITIPNSVTSIGSGAFSGCSGLTSITIPNSVTSIGSYAFSGCSGLTSIIIPNSVMSIEYKTFYNCRGLTSITIPNSVTSIGDEAFYYCRGLTSVTIPKSVMSIGDHAFEYCSGLTSITIPKSVISIGRSAFSYSGLKKITFKSFTLPKLDDYWYPFPSTVEYVYIPCGATKNYQRLTVQSKTEIPYDILATTDDEKMGTVEFVQEASCSNDQEAIISAVPNYGYHFTQWSDGNTDNPRTVVLTDDTICVAMFAPNSYTIKTTASVNGSVSGAGTYDYGTEVILTATPVDHYHFVQWSDGSTDNPHTIVVTADATYSAIFSIDTYNVTVIYDNKMGYVAGTGKHGYGSQVKLEATANSGYEFSHWGDGKTYNPYIITVIDDVTIEAVFIPSTAVENTSAEDTKGVQKVLHNGQIYILRNGKVYTLTGEEL